MLVESGTWDSGRTVGVLDLVTVLGSPSVGAGCRHGCRRLSDGAENCCSWNGPVRVDRNMALSSGGVYEPWPGNKTGEGGKNNVKVTSVRARWNGGRERAGPAR